MRVYTIGGHDYTVVMTCEGITPDDYKIPPGKLLERKRFRQLFQACNGKPDNIRAWNKMLEDYGHLDPLGGPSLSSDDDRFLAHGDFCLPDDGGRERGINLTFVELNHAYLRNVKLNHAVLVGTKLNHADLFDVHFDNANLHKAELKHANLEHAHLRETFLQGTDLSDANVSSVQYDPKDLARRCAGVRVATCHGHPLFKRDVQDADFIDTMRNVIRDERNHRRWTHGKTYFGKLLRRAKAEWDDSLFRAWGRIDYGRSFWRTAAIAFGIAMFFAFAIGAATHCCITENIRPSGRT